MQTKLTKHFLLLMAFISLFKVNAQQWLGRTTGNYSGTYGVYTNAANISDSKYKYYLNFWGRGVNFYNNYLTYNAPIKLNHWANNNYGLNYQNIDGTVDYQKDWLLENVNGKDKQFSFNQDIWGPAFMFPVSKHWNMSINTRQRSGIQMFGISESAARLAFNKLDSGDRASIKRGFGINAQSYQELSFTLGGVLAKNSRNKLSGGVTVKFIRGLGAAYLKGESLDILGTSSNSAMVSGDLQYGYTDDRSVIEPFNNPYGMFSLNSRGIGAGLDLGLSYTHKAKKSNYITNKYCDNNDRRSDHDFKLALALNDIGGIRYNRMSSKYNYSSTISNPVTVSNNILDPFRNNANAFDTIGNNVFGALGGTKSSNFSTALPTAINLQMDFRLSKHIYTSVFWNQSLKGFNSTGLRSTSMLSVIPRVESRGFEFSMPITLSENYRNFYVGAYTRIGPVFFGSDNLGGLLNVASASQFQGADIYGGISFGIGHCHSWWYQSKVDPVYIDSTKRDSIKTELRDTIKVTQRDTITVRDTIIIEKTIKTKTDIEKENALKKKEEELNKKQVILDAKEKELEKKNNGTYKESEELKKCKDQGIIIVTENTTLKDKVKTQNDAIIVANKRIADLEKENAELKKNNGTQTNAEIVRNQRKVDSLTIILVQTRTELEKCRKNSTTTNAEILKKAEDDRKKAENDAKIANRRADSLANILVGKMIELDNCKKQSTMTSAEIVKKAEADRAKAENDARLARKTSDSLKLILIQRNTELDNCKKNATQNNADIVKAQKKVDSLTIILVQRTTDYENCKKNSTMNQAEVVKKLEAEKAKAENDAKIAKKQSDSLSQVLAGKIIELENCKKSSTSNDADVQKLKTCEDNNALLKAEMAEMTKTISRLNNKSYVLSNRVDSLINELKNCCKNCSTSGSSNDDELLKKCQASNVELNAEINKLKSVITAKDKSIDSLETVSSNLNKKQVELNATISKLNSDIEDLKSKGSNCDELQKQLDAKTAEVTKLKSDNASLQNQVNVLTAQMNEYKTEYLFMVKQNQKCNAQLDSCKKGLYNNPENGTGGSGGPNPPDLNQGSTNDPGAADDNAVSSTNEESHSTKKAPREYVGLKIAGGILDILLSGSGSTTTTTTETKKETSSGRGGNTTVKSPGKTSTGSGNGTVKTSGSSTSNGGVTVTSPTPNQTVSTPSSSTTPQSGTVNKGTTVSKPSSSNTSGAGNTSGSTASGAGVGTAKGGNSTGATVERR